MTFIQGLLYGLVSGFTELLPVSSIAHQSILFRLFGIEGREPLRDLLIHISVLMAIFTGCKPMLSRIQREKKRSAGRRRNTAPTGVYELQLVRTATVPMLLVMLLYLSAKSLETNLVGLALVLILNGIILILPEYMSQANKDARSMSGLDGVIIGLLGGLSAFAGISRIGIISSYSLIRGADRQHVLDWALLLSIPAMGMFILFDLILMFAVGLGVASFVAVIGCILSAATAYLGAYLAIIFIRFLAVRSGYTNFAYYSWGAALFTMILYLIV